MAIYCKLCGAELPEPVVLVVLNEVEIVFDLCPSCNEEQEAQWADYLDETAMQRELTHDTPLPVAVCGV